MLIAACFISGQLTVAGQSASSNPSDLLLKTDVAWSKAMAAKAPDAIAFWDHMALFYRAGKPTLHGIEEIKQVVRRNQSTPGFSVQKTPMFCEVSSTEDMGYTRGEYVMTLPDADGNAVTTHGNYCCIWKRNDGTWKCVMAIAAPSEQGVDE